MPNLLAQIQSIDDRTCDIPLAPFQGFIPIEPRSVRRKKARDAAKSAKKAVVPNR